MPTAITRSIALLGVPLCLILACDDPAVAAGEGELRVGLWGDGASGQTYSLQGATFDFNGGDFSVSTDALADGTPSLVQVLPAGDHVVNLQPGWHVVRGEPGEIGTPVEATLASQNPLAFTIADNLVTSVVYLFEIDGDVVPLNSGSVDIDVEFDEDDGVCDPVTDWLWQIYGQYNGESSGLHSDGWQSFTATQDGHMTQLGILWVADETDGFTIDLHAGLGTDGPLLGTAVFDGVIPVDAITETWIIGAMTDPVDIVEGNVYTLVGHGATGWQFTPTSIPGAMSDEINAYHGLEIAGYPCE